MRTEGEVLIVSSDPLQRQAIERLLSLRQMRAVCASCVREARARMARRPVEIVFCDAQLADGSFRDLLAAGPAGQSRPPVVVVSRTADTQEYLEAMRLGAFDFLGAPLRPREVEWVLANALRHELAAAG